MYVRPSAETSGIEAATSGCRLHPSGADASGWLRSLAQVANSTQNPMSSNSVAGSGAAREPVGAKNLATVPSKPSITSS